VLRGTDFSSGRADSQYLRMALADSFLARSNSNDDAIKILDDIAVTERSDPSVVLKAAIWSSKAFRRLGEIFPSPKLTARLVHGLDVLNHANRQLRSAFLDEIERIVPHTDTSNALLHQQSKEIAKALKPHTPSVVPRIKIPNTRPHC
jgi:hypothetical protein